MHSEQDFIADEVQGLRADLQLTDEISGQLRTRWEIQGFPDRVVIEKMRQHGLFHLALASELADGVQPELPSALRRIATISAIDGSLGWISLIASGTSALGAFIQRESACSIFLDKSLVAGSHTYSGLAIPDSLGVKVSGTWQFETAAEASSWLFSGVMVQGSTKPHRKLAVIESSNVKLGTQQAMIGLGATGTRTYSCDDVLIGADRLISLESTSSWSQDPFSNEYGIMILGHGAHLLGLGAASLLVAGRIDAPKGDTGTAWVDSLLLHNRVYKNLAQRFWGEVDAVWDAVLRRSLSGSKRGRQDEL